MTLKVRKLGRGDVVAEVRDGEGGEKKGESSRNVTLAEVL